MAEDESPAVSRVRASLGPDTVLTDRETSIIGALSSNMEEGLARLRRDMERISNMEIYLRVTCRSIQCHVPFTAYMY